MSILKKLSIKKRRRGLIFAELLRCAASAAPDDDSKREVEGLAVRVERRYGFTPDEKKEAVMAMVLEGAQTVNDLVVETGFPPQIVHEILKCLETDGRVKLNRSSIHGTGRPSLIIIPIELKLI